MQSLRTSLRCSRPTLTRLLSRNQVCGQRWLSWRSFDSQPAGLPAVRGWGKYRRNPLSAYFTTHAVDDTIYALSTAPGRAAIAVIRISGPACLSVYRQLCPSFEQPKPRHATLRRLRSPTDPGQILDTGALLLYLPGPKTATGEDILELHVHGGPAIVRSVLDAIAKCHKIVGSPIRAAEAGEFTKRAFYNGRIDLTEVEALGEALVAETEQQRRLAVSGAASALTNRYEQWRSMLLYARGELEALIDFSEDQHFDESPAEFMQSVSKQVRDLKRQVELHILNSSRGELLRNGISIALLGAPNAGKSSLLNRIVGREAAIVSAEEGTTRDIVDVSIDLKGWLIRLGDMAGLRASQIVPAANDDESRIQITQAASTVGDIEKEGIRRARERALQSDLVLVLLSLQPTTSGTVELVLNEELKAAVADCQSVGKNMLFVINKIDLLMQQTARQKVSISRLLSDLVNTFPALDQNEVFCISCRDADLQRSQELDAGGLQMFMDGLVQKFTAMTTAVAGLQGNEAAIMTPAEAQTYWSASLTVTNRQSQYLKDCLNSLQDFLEISSPSTAAASTNLSEPVVKRERRSESNNYGHFDVGEAADKSIPRDQHYHVDGHEDIVGEYDPVNETSGKVMSKQGLPNKQIPYSWAAPIEPSATIHEEEFDIVTAAEHLRTAADCLARLTGRGAGTTSGTDVEDVLGVVFEKFCVGK